LVAEKSMIPAAESVKLSLVMKMSAANPSGF